MEPHLRAGLAIFNAGDFHAAHDAWEDLWLDLESGTADERFLHGLIQFTAAVYHAYEGNWVGSVGLADSAAGYLEDLPTGFHGVDVAAVRSSLATLAADPEVVERRSPPTLTHEGEVVGLSSLSFEATAVAADVYAEEDGYDESVVETAVRYARSDLADDAGTNPFVALLVDFVREPDERGIVFQRLAEHVDRRASREEDVEGLFD
jgi:hypothetical protein